MNVDRRFWLWAAPAAALAGAGLVRAAPRARQQPAAAAAPVRWEVEHSPSEWRRRLDRGQYAVLRESATEPAFSSALDHETRAGTYRCAGCALALFASAAKYDSGTGWPSFWQPLDGAVGTADDDLLGMRRTEVHCRRCGGHLGHVFDDGPPPTGLRYCINGLALVFETTKGRS